MGHSKCGYSKSHHIYIQCLEERESNLATPRTYEYYSEYGANFDMKENIVYVCICKQKRRETVGLIYETFVAQCISFQVDDWRGNVISTF